MDNAFIATTFDWDHRTPTDRQRFFNMVLRKLFVTPGAWVRCDLFVDPDENDLAGNGVFAGRAAEVAIASVLAGLLHKDERLAAKLDAMARPELRNWNGIRVGGLRPAESVAGLSP